MRKILACTGLMLLVTSGVCSATCQSDFSQMKELIIQDGSINTQDSPPYTITRIYGPVTMSESYLCRARGTIFFGADETKLSWVMGSWGSTLYVDHSR